jgi:hypothetical protein
VIGFVSKAESCWINDILGSFRSFSLGEAPTLPWRQRDGIADLRIAHGRTSPRGQGPDYHVPKASARRSGIFFL